VELFKIIKYSPVFIYAKVNTTDSKAITLLEKSGFHLVDTNITFEKPVDTSINLQGNCTVRFADPADAVGTVELARKSFVCSRFHLDQNFPNELADTVKAEWVNNYFKGKRGDSMVVALVDNRISGFLQLLHSADGTLTIDLVAVDGAQRQKGIAADMIAFAEKNIKGMNKVRIGTQVANVSSIRFSQNYGFKYVGAQYVFHYHN
jgi:ribosomal protein S18 acetylase RimI-like enzyme